MLKSGREDRIGTRGNGVPENGQIYKTYQQIFKEFSLFSY